MDEHAEKSLLELAGFYPAAKNVQVALKSHLPIKVEDILVASGSRDHVEP